MLAAALLAAVAGCGVGAGVGSVSGQLYVRQCTPESDYGTPTDGADYTLEPEFFVGEPIEDIRRGGSENRIVIRIETVGRRIRNSGGIIERGVVKDQLTFDIDVYPVARCVRAAAAGIAPGAVSMDLPRFCQVTAAGKPRIRIGYEQPIRVSFTPRATCPRNAYVVGAGRGDDPRVNGVRQPVTDPSAWASWIEWKHFGSAHEAEIGASFGLEFGERLEADAFKLRVEDDKVLKAELEERLPPRPELEADLHGRFDFDLDRGQGAQTFP